MVEGVMKMQLKIKDFRYKRLKMYVVGILTTSALVNCLSFFTYTMRNKNIDDSDDFQWTRKKQNLEKTKRT